MNGSIPPPLVKFDPREKSGALSRSDRRSRSRSDKARPISGPIVCGVVIALDLCAMLAAGLGVLPAAGPERGFAILSACLAAVIAATLLGWLHAYRFGNVIAVVRSVQKVLLVWVATVAAIAGLLYACGAITPTLQHWMNMWAAGGLILLLLLRTGIKLLGLYWRSSGRFLQRCAIIGSGPAARRILHQIDCEADSTVEIAGVFGDLADAEGHCLGRKIDTFANLLARVRRGQVADVIIALPLAEQWRIAKIVGSLRGFAVDIYVCIGDIAPRSGMPDIREIAGVPMIKIVERPLLGWRRVLKLAEDRILATAIVIGISPLLLLIALAIKLDSKGPAFFRQRRYGLNNETIEVWKFRTMFVAAADADCLQQTRRDDPRVTRVGRVLRRTSLDELPQLFNVLLGNMSLVGPRPHAIATKADGVLFEDLVRDYGVRHRVKPGITGWAQVNGWRGETQSIEDIRARVEHDLFYIENWSIALDFVVLLRTLRSGFIGKRAY